MRIRLISSAVALGLLALAIAFLDTYFFNVVIALITYIAVYEILKAAKINNHLSIVILSILTSSVVLLAHLPRFNLFIFELALAVLLAFFGLLLKLHSSVRIDQMSMAILFSVVLPLFFNCAVYIRDLVGARVGGLYILLALGTGWLTDTGAYFTGYFFGKHKLAPEISPNKTVEGAVGGVLFCTVFMLLLALGYSTYWKLQGTPVAVNYRHFALFTPIFSVIGMHGDLFASVIKRSLGVKDFGNIMPGHGGILDRFDSVLFTLPAVFIYLRWILNF